MSRRDPQVADLVAALVGTWTGTGTGGYPTIDPFTYREELTFSERDDHPSLHYEQRTWRQTPDGEEVSHWETGLLRLGSDRVATLNNAQGGRVESMAGTWEPVGSTWVITLRSTGYAGDGRVVASTRSVELSNGRFHYRMTMETTATAEASLHLAAELTRQPTG